jgi:hypothetical protein
MGASFLSIDYLWMNSKFDRSGQQAAVFMTAEIVCFTPKQPFLGFWKNSELYS